MTRNYISLYFQNGNTNSRKKKDVTIAFSRNDILYHKCKDLGSTEIKNIIGIKTYTELIEKAREEGRTLNNFIKYKLRKMLISINES